MPNRLRKIVLAGGSGFLGQILSAWFTERNWEVVVLSRQPDTSNATARFVGWDGRMLGDWAGELEGCTALVNLAGRSVNCRYHARNRKAMLDSRVDSTRVLGQAIRNCARPPRVWLNSSTATIYKHSFDWPMDEFTGVIASTLEAKDLFSIEVAKAWEEALNDAGTPQTRKVALRTAMVFSTQAGSVYRVLRRLVRLGLGGAMGRGDQFVSWIHEEDFCQAVEWLIDHEPMSGPVNLAAPNPVTNRQMMRLLRHACHVPFGLPAKRWMLEIGAILLRTETELIIKSRRVVPARLLAAGFDFRFAEMAGAIAELEQRIMASKRDQPPRESPDSVASKVI